MKKTGGLVVFHGFHVGHSSMSQKMERLGYIKIGGAVGETTEAKLPRCTGAPFALTPFWPERHI